MVMVMDTLPQTPTHNIMAGSSRLIRMEFRPLRAAAHPLHHDLISEAVRGEPVKERVYIESVICIPIRVSFNHRMRST